MTHSCVCECVRVCSRPSSPSQLQNIRLNTALHFAFERNNTALVEYLLDHGGAASEGKRNSLGLLPRQLQPHHHPIKQYIRNTLPRPELPDAALPSLPTTAPPSRAYLLCSVPCPCGV